MVVHSRFVQEAVLEGFYKTHRLIYGEVYSSCEAYAMQVIPTLLFT